MKVVRLRARVAVLLAFLYIGLMVALYLYLHKGKYLSFGLFFVGSSTHIIPSPPRYEEETKEELSLSFKRLPGQSIHAQNEGKFFRANESVDARPSAPTLNYCLQVFYYMWYGNVSVDGEYYHWNHRYLPHWDSGVSDRFPKGRHKPPDDIGASYYPLLGTYSSADPAIIKHHVEQVKRAGVGVLVVSWFPPTKSDDEGIPMTPVMPKLLDIAQKHSVKVAIHSEPYNGRTPWTFVQDLMYIYDHYYTHPALLKVQGPLGRPLPLVYVYDSYLNSAKEWSEVLSPRGGRSMRGKEYDCVVIALLVTEEHKMFVKSAGFDGFYTYFASEGFSYGSNIDVWKDLSTFAARNDLLFIPSAGPGYDDTQIRPWNAKNKKVRDNGRYYTNMMMQAFKHNFGGIVSITSFNEWHEGTQIETAIPKTITSSSKYRYLDYRPHDAWFYIDRTAHLSGQFACKPNDRMRFMI